MGSVIEKLTHCRYCSKKPAYPIPYAFEFDGNSFNQDNTKNFSSNFVKTSYYTALTFFPKALFLQFRRLANVYFLIIAILLSISVISPLSSLTAWAPLIIVIFISIAREGYEDYQRYKEDLKLNFESIATVYRDGRMMSLQWSKVIVGDICQVKAEQFFPADLFMISSAAEDGVAFIETASLDGEKNLKPRSSFKETARFNRQEALNELRGRFQSSPPEKDLDHFKAKLEVKGVCKLSAETNKQLLYRGTKLKNTKWVFGIVVFTGRNTKIIMNSESASEKQSQVENKVNHILLIVLLIQFVICLICAIAYGITRSLFESKWDYVDWPDYSVPLDSFLIFLTYFVLLNSIIPISLVVSIEMVKMFQKYFIEQDRLMFSKFRGKFSQVKSSALNEELGQIEYVFTDKTGTLTLNIMEFKIALVGNRLFGDRDLVTNTGKESLTKGFCDDNLRALLNKKTPDQLLKTPLQIKDQKGKTVKVFKTVRQLAEEYFLLLALTHQVVTNTTEDGRLVYEGPSPDQIALVDAAKAMGYEFYRSNQSTCVVKVQETQMIFQRLESFPFTSERKKMSVIVRDPRDGLIKLYSKGADSFMKERLAPGPQVNVDEELTLFSVHGLRTLVVAMRVLSQSEYKDYTQAASALPMENRQAKLAQLHFKLENHLYLIGATAVLDRLQPDVPQTIRDLIRANIKVWMLTGDKMETAENIAKSCKLIQPSFTLLRCKFVEDNGGLKLEQYLQNIAKQAEQLSQKNISKALLIENADITLILESPEYEKLLVKIAQKCETVVCCRLVPSQKAEVVSVVRRHLNKITLAIGDGANDIPMIKTAHIGVGLFGEEGSGAVQNCDYALPQFRMLWRLMFIHGRWNYIRISEMILYFFYKNMLFTTPQFVTAFYCAFSGQTIFDGTYITLYNLIFTAMPLLIRAVLEQDINYVYNKEDLKVDVDSSRQLIQEIDLPKQYGVSKYLYRLVPKTYFIGQQNCIFNSKNYLIWMLEGLFEATMISIISFYVLGDQSLNGSGESSGFYIVGLTIYSSIVFVVTFKLASHTRFWSCCMVVSILVSSIGFYIAYMWVSNYAFSFTLEGAVLVAYQTGDFYLVILFCCIFIIFIDGAVVYADFYADSYTSKIRLAMHEGEIESKEYFDNICLTITDGLTERQQ